MYKLLKAQCLPSWYEAQGQLNHKKKKKSLTYSVSIMQLIYTNSENIEANV